MKDDSRTVLVTGAAGFIGHAVAQRFLDEGWRVIGVDALSAYGGVALKKARLGRLEARDNYRHLTDRIETPGLLQSLFEEEKPNLVVHLAAQAGVRHSIEAPEDYVDANLIGTFRLLEAARANPPSHMLMASTSSVYGANTEMPYRETDRAETQMSFYAATKKATESMAHSYAHLYELPITMFRFFTVYGPWGRPDMAPMLFASAAFEGRPIRVFNHGEMKRDFTFIDDLVDAVRKLCDCAPKRPVATKDLADGDSLSPVAPYRVVNIGNAEPVPLMEFIAAIETATGHALEKQFEDMQPGDVPATWADVRLLKELTGYSPSTPIDKGVAAFVEWYRSYFNV